MREPPKGLSAEARALWREIVEQFVVDDAAGLRLLRIACEALDAQRKAEAAIGENLTILDRYGCAKAHPLLGVVRDSRTAMVRALKALGLDPGTTAKPRLGRKPGGSDRVVP